MSWRTGRRACASGRVGGRWIAVAIIVFVAGALAVWSTPDRAAAAPGQSRFVPVAPSRLLDTRPGVGPIDDGAEGVVGPGRTVRVQVGGRFGVPIGVTAVVLNLTVTEAVGPGFVQVLAGGGDAIGSFSNANVERAGQTIANQVTTPVDADGSVVVYVQGGAHVVADLFGWFTPSGPTRAGRYLPIAAPSPRRMLDTRSAVALGAGGTVRVPVAGVGGVVGEGQASAVVLNLTVTESRGPGFWQVVPTGGATAFGASSNLNVVRAGQTLSNQVIVPVGVDGSVTVYAQTGGHVVVDVAGVFSSASSAVSDSGLFVPIPPGRLVDTRNAANTPRQGPIEPAGELVVAAGGRFGVPTDAAAVSLNVTITEATAGGFVQVSPFARAALGSTSTLNVESAGQTIPNAAYASLGQAGSISIYTQRGGHLLADVAGWFTGTTTATSTPTTTAPTTAPTSTPATSTPATTAPTTSTPATTTPPSPGAPQFAFVGTWNQGASSPALGISTYRFDPSSGALTHLRDTASVNPSFFVLHPNGRVLYNVNEIGAGSVEAWAIDAGNGGLTLLDRRALDAGPTHLVIDPSGASLVIANYQAGTYQVVAIEGDGGLGAVTDREVRIGSGPHSRQASAHAHGLVFDPSGNFVVGVDLGTDEVEVFRLVNGDLQTVQVAEIAAGSGPRHVAFHPAGRVLYVVNELTATVSVFPFDPTTGAVGVIRQTIEMMPADFPVWKSGAEIVVHPGGRFLYVSHRGYVVHPVADSVVRFSIDPATGSLTRLGHTVVGIDEPRTMGFDPSASWLYVLNQGGDTISRFSVNSSTGDLVPVGAPISRRTPIGIIFTR